MNAGNLPSEWMVNPGDPRGTQCWGYKLDGFQGGDNKALRLD